MPKDSIRRTCDVTLITAAAFLPKVATFKGERAFCHVAAFNGALVAAVDGRSRGSQFPIVTAVSLKGQEIGRKSQAGDIFPQKIDRLPTEFLIDPFTVARLLRSTSFQMQRFGGEGTANLFRSWTLKITWELLSFFTPGLGSPASPDYLASRRWAHFFCPPIRQRIPEQRL
jgi:hypothetical protein